MEEEGIVTEVIESMLSPMYIRVPVYTGETLRIRRGVIGKFEIIYSGRIYDYFLSSSNSSACCRRYRKSGVSYNLIVERYCYNRSYSSHFHRSYPESNFFLIS